MATEKQRRRIATEDTEVAEVLAEWKLFFGIVPKFGGEFKYRSIEKNRSGPQRAKLAPPACLIQPFAQTIFLSILLAGAYSQGASADIGTIVKN